MTEEIILENQNLIYSIIHKYYESYGCINDLFQVGCLGLIKAYKKFDSSYDVKFSSFAYKYIMGEISQYIRDNRSVKVSSDLQKLYYKVEKVRILLYQKYMREPTCLELASFLEMTEDKVIEILSLPMNIQSLDEKVGFNDNDLSLYEVVPDKESDINDILALKIELDSLSSEEKELINMRYNEDLSQCEVAKRLGINQVQVSRNEQKVLKKLKSKLLV